MLILISPAKKLDFESPLPPLHTTQPDLLAHSQALIDELRALAPQDIAGLMGLSDKLALLNYERFQDWHLPFSESNARAALFAFKGDVYQGLNAEQFDQPGLDWAQNHLRILSGLYGVLRPLDLMQAYRLEMGTKFANQRGRDLYQFWGDIITGQLNDELANSATPVLINLASGEYYKSVREKKLNARVITPVFMDEKNGSYKIISFFAKKARGLMSAYIIRHQLEDAEQIKQFAEDGYCYNSAMSEGGKWVFCRKQ